MINYNNIVNYLLNTLTLVSCSSYPLSFSALQVYTTPLSLLMPTFDIVIIDVFPLDESSIPLRYQLIFIGGIPLIMLQVIVRSYPSAMYAGDPIITVTSLLGMTSGCGIHCPSAIIGRVVPISK